MSVPMVILKLTMNAGALMIAFLRQLLGLDLSRKNRVANTTANSPMDQGDYHSGPEGYTPNTAYPETQYGSNFDEDAAWNEGNPH